MSDLIYKGKTYKGLPVEPIDGGLYSHKLQHNYDCLINPPCDNDRLCIIRATLKVPEQPNLSFPLLSTKTFEGHLLDELRWSGEEEHRQNEVYYRERIQFAWYKHETFYEGKHGYVYHVALFIEGDLYHKALVSIADVRIRLQMAWCRTLKMATYEPGKLVWLGDAAITELDKAKPEYFNDLAHVFRRMSFLAQVPAIEQQVLERL